MSINDDMNAINSELILEKKAPVQTHLCKFASVCKFGRFFFIQVYACLNFLKLFSDSFTEHQICIIDIFL